MLLGLTSGQKIGLLAVAGAFIVFSIVASFLFPRRNPDWPGRRLGAFVAVTLVLFVAMMTAVFVLAKEKEEAGGREGGATATSTNEQEAGEGPGAGEAPAAGEPGAKGEGAGAPGSEGGDAAAGKSVFASAGCGSCHALADANSSGAVGPNLDEAKPAYDLVVERVTNGKSPMPAFENQLSEKQIRDVSAYVVGAAGSG